MFVGRTSFAAHYDFEDRFIYVLGGNISSESRSTNLCEKFDVYNLKWHKMPAMKEERANPGTFITADKKYLYAVQGFKNDNVIVESIERLDLTDQDKGWEIIILQGEPLKIGSFVMFPLAKLTRQIQIWQKDAAKWGDKTSIIDLKKL